MIGIIGAMDIEVSGLKEAMDIAGTKTVAGMEFCFGKISGRDVVVSQCGIGKVNAAICVQILADVFSVDAVINTGVAGALLTDLNICDIVLSTCAQEYDMDVGALGYEKGIIPDMDTSIFLSDERMLKLAKDCATKLLPDTKVVEGKVVSGDRFVGSDKTSKTLRQDFDGACAEMEGAAIAHAAHLNNIPYLVVRAISDRADGNGSNDYNAFKEKAAKKTVALMLAMVAQY